MKKFLASQSGDTIIEVTMALAILAVVLMSATLVTTRAFRLGQTARERTTMAEAAQGQAEELRSFRDNHTWSEFLYGGSIAGVAYNGVLTIPGGPGCHVSTPCAHMLYRTFAAGAVEFVPSASPVAGPVPTSYLEISVTPLTAPPVTSVSVTVSYGFTELGGSNVDAGHIKTTLTQL